MEYPWIRNERVVQITMPYLNVTKESYQDHLPSVKSAIDKAVFIGRVTKVLHCYLKLYLNWDSYSVAGSNIYIVFPLVRRCSSCNLYVSVNVLYCSMGCASFSWQLPLFNYSILHGKLIMIFLKRFFFNFEAVDSEFTGLSLGGDTKSR